MTSTERLEKEVGRLRQENNQANQDCRKWIEQAATQRVRAEKAEADNAKLVELVHQIIEWYDVDDCLLGNTSELFEQVRAVLKEVADASSK